MTYQVCRACRQPVILARTEAHGRLLLLDPEPNPAGRQAVMQPPAGPLQTRQLSKDENPRSYETVHMIHLATCPKRVQQAPAPAPLPRNVIPITRAPSNQRGSSIRPRGTP